MLGQPGWSFPFCTLETGRYRGPTETAPLLRIQITPEKHVLLILRRIARCVVVGEGSNGTNGINGIYSLDNSPTRGDVSASPARMLHTTSRDSAEWLEFSRGLVIERVLSPLLLVASQATVPHRLV